MKGARVPGASLTNGPDVQAVAQYLDYVDLVAFTQAKVPGNPLGFKVFVTFAEHRRKNPISVTFLQADLWIEVRVRVKRGLPLPHYEFVRTHTSGINDRTAQILMGQRFVYEGQEVKFSSMQEAAAFGAGNGLYWALRKLKRIEGRLAHTTRNVHGLKWLEEYRKWIESGKDMSTITPEDLVGQKRKRRTRKCRS